MAEPTLDGSIAFDNPYKLHAIGLFMRCLPASLLDSSDFGFNLHGFYENCVCPITPIALFSSVRIVVR